MAGRSGLKIWLLYWAIFWTQWQHSLGYNLPEMLKQPLKVSNDQFDDRCRHLSEEEQQRFAGNFNFLEKSQLELEELQQLLSNNSGIHSPLKRRLWLSLYWQLRRSHRFDNDNMLLLDFALNLRRLQTDPEWNSSQLQNMLQSLPKALQILVRSRWLCLAHDRDLMYLMTAGALQLGASSRCCMWQLALGTEPSSHGWLRLENLCDAQDVWYFNMLQQLESGVYLMQREPNSNSSNYCSRLGSGYYKEVAGAEAKDVEKDCHWQLNDCSGLPSLLQRFYGV
ncbi:PREDICTED: uncharacterized protein LOC108615197 [Drosophila arizonae]|uniref:Uncharacterized protein LOC108615197 n=1 Tax=Drosophila arizonae TaxID=7263 RepID=A0ABM1PCU2_DROAR|nr:PREDICTED: uncharacterized protein LOC108615197 [Drosophila arizonae]